jgi:hypothetical protein
MSDHQNPELWYRGKSYTFPELVEERDSDRASFERDLNPETYERKFNSCQAAIKHLASTMKQVSPDVVVIFGDDQHESFYDDNMPAMSIYWGETIDDAPNRPQNGSPAAAMGIFDTPYGNPPETRVTHPAEARLGRYLIESLVEQGFDMAHTNKLPQGRHEGAIGHAHNFVYRRLMNNQVIPNVPVFLNTYYPPNQPTMKRCYQLGQGIRQALEGWDSDKTVALVASGGLTHFVIEEDLDQHIIEGLREGTAQKLTDKPNSYFNSGTSEIRNWVVVAGAMAGDGLQFNLVDYVPCYRTEAGTGCAMAFAEWK